MSFEQFLLIAFLVVLPLIQHVVQYLRRQNELPEQAEGAAFGAALQALWSHGRANGRDDGIAAITAEHVRVDPALSVRPDHDAAEAYRTHYQRFLRQHPGLHEKGGLEQAGEVVEHVLDVPVGAEPDHRQPGRLGLGAHDGEVSADERVKE